MAGEPNRPTISAADDETGSSFTITIDGDNGVTNYLEYIRRDINGTIQDGGSRSDDGTIVASSLSTGFYEAWVISENGSGFSRPSEPLLVWVTSGSHATEVRERIVYLLGQNSSLVSLLADADSIFVPSPPQERKLPCVALQLEPAPFEELDTYGRLTYRMSLDVWSISHDTNDAILEQIDATLFDTRFSTTAWDVKYLRRTSARNDWPKEIDESGQNIAHLSTEWVVEAYRKGE